MNQTIARVLSSTIIACFAKGSSEQRKSVSQIFYTGVTYSSSFKEKSQLKTP